MGRLGGILGRLGLGASWALLGGLGRCQNALGTFQEAPERESLIFQWVSEIWMGVRPCGAHGRGWNVRPLNEGFSRKLAPEERQLEFPFTLRRRNWGASGTFPKWAFFELFREKYSDGVFG